MTIFSRSPILKPVPPPSKMPIPNGLLQRKCACGGSPGAGGECTECQKKRLDLQRKEAGGGGPAIAPPIVHEVLSSPGRPLDREVRSFMEPRLGHDFRRVRVHTDARAAESAKAVGALAYTVGADLVFSAGRYEPGNPEGQRLLAHELAHVVQQQAAPTAAQKEIRIADRADEAEREAEAVSSRVAGGGRDTPRQTTSWRLARTPDPGLQVECVKRLGGCPNTRPGGVPEEEEIHRYNEECRRETDYDGPDVTPTSEECAAPGAPPPTPTTVFLCSKSLERSPLGTHVFFRIGGTGTGRPTLSLEPEDRGSDCWQGEPKRNFSADVNASADCLRTSLDLVCLEREYSAYPIGHYCTLGPNSNTFAGHLARRCGLRNPDPPGWNPGIDDNPPSAGTFSPSPDSTLLGCRLKSCQQQGASS